MKDGTALHPDLKYTENGSRLADSSNSTKRPTGSETDQKGVESEMNWSRTEVDRSPHYFPQVEVRFNVSPEKDEIPPVDCSFSLCLRVLELCLNSCPMDFRLAWPAPAIYQPIPCNKSLNPFDVMVEYSPMNSSISIRVYPTSSKKLFPLLRSSSIFSGTGIQRQKSVSAGVGNVRQQGTPRFTFPLHLCTLPFGAQWLVWFCSSYERLEFLH
nr:PREDICTED: uncharacterized protein LOC109448396 [Rhinolophus sinicus]